MVEVEVVMHMVLEVFEGVVRIALEALAVVVVQQLEVGRSLVEEDVMVVAAYS